MRSPIRRSTSAATIVALAVLMASCKDEHLPPPPTDSATVEKSAPVEKDAAVDASAGQVAPTMSGPAPIAPSEVVLSQLPPGTPIATCHIDELSAGGMSGKPDAPLQIRDARILSVAGWAATPDENAVPSDIDFRLLADGSDGKVWEFKTVTGKDRNDVATFKGKPALATSGFAFSADLSGLPAGTYHAYLAFSHQDKGYSCNGGDKIVIE